MKELIINKMAKSKLKTPDWILKGDGKSVAKKKGKTFKIKVCPECDSDEVGVVLGENGIWECKKCKWKGENIKERELDEEEFMKYLDDKGEEIA